MEYSNDFILHNFEEDEIQYKIEVLKDCLNKLEEIQSEISGVVYKTDLEVSYYAYGKYGLDQLLGNGNPHDAGVPDMIKHLKSLKKEES